ncbi:hypothetical protein TUM19329_12350 [Legionella antarctica]|uniref:Uncharacterized protein n=1 Tax=Legionella antarctica TaxID=2708020 RepID=A0A6F8T2G3_9GAMM|nr:hypothetical protein [Legionella antarctica]BCA94874.1 hypothetical protein TUM19329_12350 [Legionella antarctica]
MRIIHIAQLHKIPFINKPTKEVFDRVIQSQLKVAQEIKKHPHHFPVVVEGLSKNLKDASFSGMSNYLKMRFPSGLPTNSNELNQKEKEFIYEYGAALTLFILGEIPSIYKSIHKEAHEVIRTEISNGNFQNIFAPREEEAIKCIKETAINHFGKIDDSTVIIVFGAKHNFKPYCIRENFDLEVIDTTLIDSPLIDSPLIDSPLIDSPLIDSPLIDSPLIDSPLIDSTTASKLSDERYSSVYRNTNSAFFSHEIKIRRIVPEGLQKIIEESGVESDYVETGHTSMDNLIELYEKKPWVIDALRYSNIREGIWDDYISIEQYSGPHCQDSDPFNLRYNFNSTFFR